MAQEPSTEPDQEKGKSRHRTAKALTRVRLLYRALTWDRLKTVINASVSNATKLLWIVLCVLLFTFVVRDLSTELIAIEPISVPKAFSENGYTPEVASRRLRDALSDYASKSKTLMKSPNIAPSNELPNIIVPKIDLSLDTVVSSIRSVLHNERRHTISGEMIIRGKLAWLRLRVDGREVFSSPNGIDIENPDELFVAAVPDTMYKIRPYLVAAAMYKADPKKAAQKAGDIIDHLPASDINVVWACVLKGLFLIEHEKDYPQAEALLQRAVFLDATNSVAHNNLGLAMDRQGRRDVAIAEYRHAMELDKKYATPHNNLGAILKEEGKVEEAIAEYRNAMELDKTFASPHSNLAIVLAEQGKPEEAIAEYHRALEIDPKLAAAHNNLGLILNHQGKLDKAILEFRLATEADPNDLIAKNNLQEALRRQKQKLN